MVSSLLARSARHEADDECVRDDDDRQRQGVECDGREQVVGQLMLPTRKEIERDTLTEPRVDRVALRVKNNAL